MRGQAAVTYRVDPVVDHVQTSALDAPIDSPVA